MKLLNKSLKGYLLFSALTLLVSIPVFYFEIKSIVAEDVDEDLVARKSEMLVKLEKVIDKNPFEFLEAFEPDLYIKQTTSLRQKDTIYTINEYDSVAKENVPHRVLESTVGLDGNSYTIRLKSSLLDNNDLIGSIVMVQAILMGLILTGLLVITQIHSKKLWKPFYSTLEKLHEYKIESEKSITLDKTDINEFSDLNQTIHSLTERNHQVYLSQKEFTENASHEMQTPLAIFQSKVELLMQTAPLTIEQAELITELSDAGQRMNRLNRTLLLLSKIDNHQFPDDEDVNLDATVQKLIGQYKNALKQKNITLSIKVRGNILIEASQTLVDILIGNMLSNSIKHNIQGGQINITITNSEFIISNTGKAQSLDTSKLFQRFQKQSTDAGSLGLGLEMVKRICNLYKAEISYSYNETLHTFTFGF